MSELHTSIRRLGQAGTFLRGAFEDGAVWAVWTTARDQVCTPGWWVWDGEILYPLAGGKDAEDAEHGVTYLITPPTTCEEDWAYMVEQLLVDGDLTHGDWKRDW